MCKNTSSTGKIKSTFANLYLYLRDVKDMLSVCISECVFKACGFFVLNFRNV